LLVAGGDGERGVPRPPDVRFGVFALLDALAVGAGARIALDPLATGAGAGSTLGGAAVAGAALDSSVLASDCGAALPPDRNTRMPVTSPTATAEIPATTGIDRLGGLRTVGASCVAVTPVPVVISVDALVASDTPPGVEGLAAKGADGGAAMGALGGGCGGFVPG
jgi:hypothetical protein